MGRILPASIASGTASVPLFFIIGFARNSDSVEISLNLLSGILLSAGFIWITAALCAFVLLIPLIPIVDRIRPVFSATLFILLGFCLPAWLMFQSLHMGSHGNLPPIETKPWGDLALSITSAGVIGLGAALAAWFCVRKPISAERQNA